MIARIRHPWHVNGVKVQRNAYVWVCVRKGRIPQHPIMSCAMTDLVPPPACQNEQWHRVVGARLHASRAANNIGCGIGPSQHVLQIHLSCDISNNGETVGASMWLSCTP
jgi:hypothetical protein